MHLILLSSALAALLPLVLAAPPDLRYPNNRHSRSTRNYLSPIQKLYARRPIRNRMPNRRPGSRPYLHLFQNLRHHYARSCRSSYRNYSLRIRRFPVRHPPLPRPRAWSGDTEYATCKIQSPIRAIYPWARERVAGGQRGRAGCGTSPVDIVWRL